MDNSPEAFVETSVKYNIEFKGKHIVIENLPVHMNEDNEEYYISSSVMKYLINVILEQFAEASEAESDN